jgi:hypothetical protein
MKDKICNGFQVIVEFLPREMNTLRKCPSIFLLIFMENVERREYIGITTIRHNPIEFVFFIHIVSMKRSLIRSKNPFLVISLPGRIRLHHIMMKNNVHNKFAKDEIPKEIVLFSIYREMETGIRLKILLSTGSLWILWTIVYFVRYNGGSATFMMQQPAKDGSRR